MEVFGKADLSSDEVFAPEIPFGIRFNCKEGCVKDATGKRYGDKIEVAILSFKLFYGSLGRTENTEWAQIFFVGESDNLPPDTLLVAYFKTRSLDNFKNLLPTIQSKGIEPATGVFSVTFDRHTHSFYDKDKQQEMKSEYYSLKWGWKERPEGKETAARLLKLSQALDKYRGTKYMEDLSGTRNMTPYTRISAAQESPSELPEAPLVKTEVLEPSVG
jgi:hypothetical protein